jgi:hypothetical protein
MMITLCVSPTKYTEKLIKNYEKLFDMKPKDFTSPSEKGDHAELDTSELCTTAQISQYQSMNGSLQWIVTIGRFGTHTAPMTMSRFRVASDIDVMSQYWDICSSLLNCYGILVPDLPLLSSSTTGTLVLYYTTWYWQVLLVPSSTCILPVLWFGDLPMGRFVPGFH